VLRSQLAGRPNLLLTHVNADHFPGPDSLGEANRDRSGAAPAVDHAHAGLQVWQEERGRGPGVRLPRRLSSISLYP
jgi:hypothetical protein